MKGPVPHVSSGTLQNSFDRRSVVLGALQGGVGVLLAARLTYLSVFESDRYKTLAESNRVNLTLIPPRRGWVLDRHGAPLASNRADFRVVEQFDERANVVAAQHGAEKLGSAGATDDEACLRAMRYRGQIRGLDLGSVIDAGRYAIGDQVEQKGGLGRRWVLQEPDQVGGLLR